MTGENFDSGRGRSSGTDWSAELRELLANRGVSRSDRIRPGEIDTIMVHILAAVVTLVSDRFLLEAHTALRPEGVYVQGMVEDDGSLHLEVPSNEFLQPPIAAQQVARLIELGWQPPASDLPNFWRVVAAESVIPGQVATHVARTLQEVYGVSASDEFTLAPAGLAAVALPENGEIEFVEWKAPDGCGDDLTLPIDVGPSVSAIVARAVHVGAIVHPTASQSWFGLRGTATSKIAVYVRRRWLTVLMPLAQADRVVATGLATVEKTTPSTSFVRLDEDFLRNAGAIDLAGAWVLDALGLAAPVAASVASAASAAIPRSAPPVPVGSPSSAARLALSVARCREVERARVDPTHPCRKIVCLQQDEPEHWQVPEPWAGNLTGGRIVFVSSNPSINADEEYPRGSWQDGQIGDFVTNRFDGHWVKDEKVLLRDGTYYPKKVQFWLRVRKRAAELLGRPADPSLDYVMTEAVHCKSTAEQGVSQAAPRCVSTHLGRILDASPAELVVILGSKALNELKPLWRLPAGFGTKETIGVDEGANLAVRHLGGRPRVIAFLRHPTGMTAPQSLSGTYPTRLPELRQLVAGELRVDHFSIEPAR